MFKCMHEYQMHSMVDLFCRDPRFHHHGCNVQDFSRQLQTNTCQQQTATKESHNGGRASPFYFTLHTTLIPSMSSGERILICDVPFKNCSDSDIPVGRKRGQTTGINHTSTRGDADELFQLRPWKKQLLPVYFQMHCHAPGFKFVTLIVFSITNDGWLNHVRLNKYQTLLLFSLLLQLGSSWQF